MLAMLGRLRHGRRQYQAVEFCGEAVRALAMQERMTLRQHERRARCAGRPGGTGRDDAHLAGHARRRTEVDIDAMAHATSTRRGARHVFDADALAPQVAAAAQPGQRPARGRTRAHADRRRLSSAPAPAPSSTTCALRPRVLARATHRARRAAAGRAGQRAQDAAQAEREGVIARAGRCRRHAAAQRLRRLRRLRSSHPRGQHRRSRSTARNFKGRMGAATAQVYLGSPYTVAASARARRDQRCARDAGERTREPPRMGAGVRTWKLPADVDTDQLAPGATMKHGIDVIARHCLEAVRPEFAARRARRAT